MVTQRQLHSGLPPLIYLVESIRLLILINELIRVVYNTACFPGCGIYRPRIAISEKKKTEGGKKPTASFVSNKT